MTTEIDRFSPTPTQGLVMSKFQHVANALRAAVDFETEISTLRNRQLVANQELIGLLNVECDQKSCIVVSGSCYIVTTGFSPRIESARLVYLDEILEDVAPVDSDS